MAQIEPLDCLADIEPQDAPEPLVGDTDETGGGEDRPLAHQQQSDLLEQQGETAVRSGPWHVDAQHTVVGAVGRASIIRSAPQVAHVRQQYGGGAERHRPLFAVLGNM